MNWLFPHTNWFDYLTNTSPPVEWDDDDQRYEVVIPGGGPNSFHIYQDETYEEDGILDLSFSVNELGEGESAYLLIVNSDTMETVSVTELSLGLTGRVTIPTIAGNYYEVFIGSTSEDTGGAEFTNLAMHLVPIVFVELGAFPWWYCPPKEPIVCPDRAVGFVPFDEYDENFKYPLASSRVPSKVQVLEDCTTCSPTIQPVCVIPPEEPEEAE